MCPLIGAARRGTGSGGQCDQLIVHVDGGTNFVVVVMRVYVVLQNGVGAAVTYRYSWPLDCNKQERNFA